MKPTLSIVVIALLLLIPCACRINKSQPEPYKTDRLTIAEDFKVKTPANIAILPVEGVGSLNATNKGRLRSNAYNIFLEKNYAPLSLSFTDRTLRKIGRNHTPLLTDDGWNTQPFKGALSSYCDAVAFISVERYLESGQPDKKGIQIWGKVGLFDTSSMELLMEYYTRQTLHPTDPGGGRDRFVRKAMEEFAELLLVHLPAKNPEKG